MLRSARMAVSLAIAFIGAIAAPAAARAQAPADSISAGTQWLLDARYGWVIWSYDSPPDLTQEEITAADFKPTYVRDTLAATHALLSAGRPTTDYEQAIDWIAGFGPPLASHLAERIEVLAKANQNVSTFIDKLIAYQNPDGGFGATIGYPSDILSTASALEALAAAGQTSSTAAASAVSYLLSRQSADGGFAEGDNSSSVYLTAQAFRGLYPYRHQNVSVPAALDKAKSFLLSQRDASGSWGETFNTAYVLTALIPYLPDLSSVQESITALASAQLANGSFDNDPYATALALQALYLASLPQPNPDYVSIKGKVIEAQTGLPLSGVAVT